MRSRRSLDAGVNFDQDVLFVMMLQTLVLDETSTRACWGGLLLPAAPGVAMDSPERDVPAAPSNAPATKGCVLDDEFRLGRADRRATKALFKLDQLRVSMLDRLPLRPSPRFLGDDEHLTPGTASL